MREHYSNGKAPSVGHKKEETAPWRHPALVAIIGFLRFVFILTQNFYVVPAYLVVVGVMKLLMVKNHASLLWYIEGVLFRWVLTIITSWMTSAGYKIVLVGEDMSSILEEEAVLIANHQSTGDVPMMFATLQELGTPARRSMWIMDVMFKCSHFGVMSMLRGDFFIQQGRETRHLQAGLLRSHFAKAFWPNNRGWIVLFPEGGFLRKRRITSQEYAHKHGYPVLQHVTLPRVGALQTMLETASLQGIRKFGSPCPDAEERPIKWIVDVTIGYEERPQDVQSIVFGLRPPMTTQLYFRKFATQDIPLETEALTQWMYARFQEKEELLKEYYRTGSFPKYWVGPDGEQRQMVQQPRVLTLSYQRLLFINLFYITLSWIEWRLFSNLLSTVMAVLGLLL